MLPDRFATSVYVPRVSHNHPLPPPGDPPRPEGRSVSGSYQITAFALGPGTCESFCAPFKTELSISPNPVELLQSSLAGHQSQMLWGLLFLVLTPGLRSLTWDSELLLLWQNLCNIIILQFVGHPPR